MENQPQRGHTQSIKIMIGCHSSQALCRAVRRQARNKSAFLKCTRPNITDGTVPEIHQQNPMVAMLLEISI